MLVSDSAGGSVAVALLVMLSTPALASDFVVTKALINQVMQPKNAIEVIQDCAKNAVCRSAVDAGATALGAPPGAVTAAVVAIPRAERKGEEGFYTFALPKGYQYCRSAIETVSVVPATGDRASYMSASSQKSAVAVYTWTPKQGAGKGRSWVEANLTIYGVSDSAADANRAQGRCRPIGQKLIECRGAKGVNKGLPACGRAAD